jgi:hypothetical protein
MPSRKQRRRRAKERRHEYEIVYVDDEGHEVPADVLEDVVDTKSEPSQPRSRDGQGPKTRRADAGRQRSSTRTIQPPSWRRVGKRALIFGPFMFITIALLNRGAGLGSQLFITGQMMLLFIPFSYLMDRMLYRRHLRSLEATPGQASRKRS